MKIFIVICIVVGFGAIGYLYKLKLEHDYRFLKFIENFIDYYYSNIVLYKNNTIEIIDNYIIMQKNKNANYCKLFLKNTDIYKINNKILKYYISGAETISVIESYFLQMGKSEYEYEIEKLKSFRVFIKAKSEESYLNFKNKGNLYFKIILSFGAILAILIW